MQQEDRLNALLKEFERRTPMLLGSIGGIGAGIAMLWDDRKDIGLSGAERDPPMPHHWMWGVLSLLGGVVGLGMVVVDAVKAANGGKLPAPALEPEEKMKETGINPWDLVPKEVKESLR